MTRWPTTPAWSAPTRWRRCASSTSSSGASSGPAVTHRGHTSSSSSPIMGRHRARPSSSATATTCARWSSARSRMRPSPGRRRATRTTPRPGMRSRRPRGDGRDETRRRRHLGDHEVVVLGSGNLGLIYLMDSAAVCTLEEIDERHPRLLTALRTHPHIGFVLVQSRATARWCSAPRGRATCVRSRRGRRPAGAVLAQRRRASAAGPTDSPTPPTSWSTASTTRSSSRAARSRS